MRGEEVSGAGYGKPKAAADSCIFRRLCCRSWTPTVNVTVASTPPARMPMLTTVGGENRLDCGRTHADESPRHSIRPASARPALRPSLECQLGCQLRPASIRLRQSIRQPLGQQVPCERPRFYQARGGSRKRLRVSASEVTIVICRPTHFSRAGPEASPVRSISSAPPKDSITS